MTGPTSDHAEIQHWAETHKAVPIEVLPHIVDAEPALLRLVLAEQAKDHANARIITWEEFFLKFDSMALAFVYDTEPTGYNEILQIEDRSPYLNPVYRLARSQN